jgi:hypothetical protein
MTREYTTVPTLPLAVRQAAFATLVYIQDRGRSVGAARAETARRYNLTLTQVRAIEREGVDFDWPPLDTAA